MRITSILLSACFLLSLNLSAQWQPLSNFNTARASAGLIQYGDSLLLVGGQELSGELSSIEVFNLNTDTWESPMSLNQGRMYASVIMGDSGLYVAGGAQVNSTFTGIDALSTMERYHNGQWTTINMPGAFNAARAFKVGSKLIFGGGYVSAVQLGGATITVDPYIYIYDESNGSWSTDSLSIARCFTGAASDGQKVIFAGGLKDDYTATNRVDLYDVASGTWTIDSLSTSRAALAGAYADGKFYFAGGSDPVVNSSSDLIDVYDGSSWSTMNLSTSRALPEVVMVGPEIYFIGGGDISWSNLLPLAQSKTVDVYNTQLGSWSNADLFVGTALHSVASVNYDIYLMGGVSQNTISSQVYRYRSSIGLSEVAHQAKPKLVRVINFMGQEVDPESSGSKIYIYEDGSTEKYFDLP